MSLFRKKTGIVNVRMVITEEKILSNIDKIQKLINPNSKKQIVQLDDDAYFKDLIDSVKTYLNEYPNKKNFPAAVYKAAYGLVEYATNQFEENTKKIEDLIIQREKNIELAVKLKDILAVVENKEKDWKNQVKEAESYNVYQGSNLIASGITDTKYTVENLDAETNYCFVVTAVNIVGESEDSESACATTFKDRPAAPIVTATADNESEITLTWESVDGALSYNVYQDGTKISSGITNPCFLHHWFTNKIVSGLLPNH